MIVEIFRVVICRVNLNKYYIILVDFDNYNVSWVFDIRSIFFVWKYSFNYIGVYNNLRKYVFFCIIVNILGKYVYIVLWCGEYFRMFIIMVVDICNNGVKVNGRIFGYFCCMDRYVCRKCYVIWE